MMNRYALGGLCLAAIVSMPVAVAAQELVTNGNFSQTFTTGSQSATTPSQLGYNGYGVTSWTSSPSNAYTFLFNPVLAGSAGYTSSGQYGDIQLYTSANGGSGTAPASLVSPVGGNFIASDPAFQSGTLSQTINNLVAGKSYVLSFWWAAGQQAGFTGATTESWTGTFGNSSFSTSTVTTPDKGFSPWMKFTTTVVANSTSNALSFLAVGGPSGGQPPFVLLDGVSLTAAVPEPATWAMMLLGFGGVGYSLRRRAKMTSRVRFA